VRRAKPPRSYLLGGRGLQREGGGWSGRGELRGEGEARVGR